MANGQVYWKSAIIGAALVLAVIGAGWVGYNWPSDGPTDAPRRMPAAQIAVASDAATPPTGAVAAAAPSAAPKPPTPTATPATPAPVPSKAPNAPPIARDRLSVLQTSYDMKYLVIMGSYPYSGPMPEAQNQRIKQCLGVTPHIMPTGFYEGLAPELYVIIFGGYDKAEAEMVRQWVRPCVPDAYIKQARWIGD